MTLNISTTVHGAMDISTVYAYYTQEYMDSDPQFYGENNTGYQKKCDSWSCFNNQYARGAEKEFIESIASDKYSHYLISWVDCN